MHGSGTPVPGYPPCESAVCQAAFERIEQDIENLKRDVEKLREKQVTHGERLASIEGRMALAAAIGAVAGSGLVTLITKLLH
jgi:hypothetical protein